MNGFELHRITHTSPSAINTWKRSRKNFILQKLFFQKSQPNAAMQRGIVVESAVASVLTGKATIENAITAALKEFNSKLRFCNDPKMGMERGQIGDMIIHACAALSIYGVPDFNGDKQHGINLLCRTDRWTLPVHGYIDFKYPKHKLIIDLKTTGSIPENMSEEHKRQGAAYKHANQDYDVKFLYVTNGGSGLHSIGEHMETMWRIKEILIEQEAFLASDSDKNKLLEVVSNEQ